MDNQVRSEMTVHLTETTKDLFGEYQTVWMCVPSKGHSDFKVLEDHWNDDYTERVIFKIELVEHIGREI
jgi:hypothetical protein